MGREIEWTDHTGQQFKSFELMCRHWNMSSRTVHTRLNQLHWSLEKALTTPVKEKPRNNKSVGGVVVHNIWYPTLKKACEVLHKDYRTINSRLKNHSIEEAFSDNFNSTPQSKGEVVDPFDPNLIHKSFSVLCKYHGLTHSIVTSRMKSGETLEEALSHPSKPNRTIIELPNGERFDSLEKALKAKNISRSTYLKRINNNMYQAEALTTPAATQGKEIEIPGYGKFKSINYACKQLGIPTINITTLTNKHHTTPEIEIIKILDKVKCMENIILHIFNERYTFQDIQKVFGIGTYELYTRLIRDKMDQEVAVVIPPFNPDMIRFRFKGVSGKGRYTAKGSKDYISSNEIIAKYKPELLPRYIKVNPTGTYNPYTN